MPAAPSSASAMASIRTRAPASLVLKQRVARRLLASGKRRRSGAQLELWKGSNPTADHFWQRRFYDFNVWSKKKRVEKLRYMHRNPVKRGLVESPELWPWSSFRHYLYGQPGLVTVNDWPAVVSLRKLG